jgi:hypothetical protein
MERFKYVKTSEKEEIMKISCIIKTVEGVIENLEANKPEEKRLIKNLRTGTTYIRKAVQEITDAMDENQMLEVQKFVEKKHVLIADPNDARIINSKPRLNVDEVAVSQDIMKSVCESIKLNHCLNDKVVCNPKECPYRKLMTEINIEGLAEYKECPFEK